ncbi:hypothetical protein K435DRAFT_165892 [Dendrothele bispora CBS 962.96]|uniref:Transmembrane protein n=1 Tax=Dendrothele bispora (strain CBS 962.96) TaxID=1314807 RepID=A0A4S8LX52_DENBC|nr:hypothetical protein K435DRAFT_165892 [Dendrothele bispora CBS 962.96]
MHSNLSLRHPWVRSAFLSFSCLFLVFFFLFLSFSPCCVLQKFSWHCFFSGHRATASTLNKGLRWTQIFFRAVFFFFRVCMLIVSLERGTRSGRIFSSWFLTNQPDPVPLRAPRSFDLEAATAHAESLRDEVEAHAEADAEDRVLYTELDSVSNDVNPLPLPKDTPSSDPTTTAVEPRMSLALDSFQHPQTGPVRSKDARTQHFTAPTRVKYEERRLKLEQEASEGIPSTLESVDQKRVNSSHPLMTSGYNVESTRVGCNSWTGPRVEGEETPISLEDLIQKKNMTLCSWDGKYVCSFTLRVVSHAAL